MLARVVSEGALPRVQNWRRVMQARWFECTAVALFALVLRLAGLSGPYFADAFRHIRAIDSGRIVIRAGLFCLQFAGLETALLGACGDADVLGICR